MLQEKREELPPANQVLTCQEELGGYEKLVVS